jgi:hypothetical protein
MESLKQDWSLALDVVLTISRTSFRGMTTRSVSTYRKYLQDLTRRMVVRRGDLKWDGQRVSSEEYGECLWDGSGSTARRSSYHLHPLSLSCFSAIGKIFHEPRDQDRICGMRRSWEIMRVRRVKSRTLFHMIRDSIQQQRWNISSRNGAALGFVRGTDYLNDFKGSTWGTSTLKLSRRIIRSVEDGHKGYSKRGECMRY